MRHFRGCGVCGAPAAHATKECPLRRVNEKQEVLAPRHACGRKSSKDDRSRYASRYAATSLEVLSCFRREPGLASARCRIGRQKVLTLIGNGFKNKGDSLLGTSHQMIRNYVSELFDITGMSNRVELALWFQAKSKGSGRDHNSEMESGGPERH